MTPEAMNRKLAEWCGHRSLAVYYQYEPDYASSLDAVAEVEVRLTHDDSGQIYSQRRHYLNILRHDTECPEMATALQRCTALCRTLGLWEGDV